MFGNDCFLSKKKGFLCGRVSQARTIHPDIPEANLGPSRVAMVSWPSSGNTKSARVIHAVGLPKSLLMRPGFVRHLPGTSRHYVAAAVLPRGP